MPNQYPNDTMGQTPANPKVRTPYNEPDTDSRLIKVTDGSTLIYPNLMHDHTRFEYIVPTGNTQQVEFSGLQNTEDRGLHCITLDNSNNGSTKTFVFSSDYVFLDDPTNTTNTYIVSAGAKLIWFGTFTDGKLYLRVSSESTN